MQIKENYSLKPYNTFGIDVKAKVFIEIFNEEELREVLFSEELKDQEKIILGGGSNVLFIKDFDGVVIKNSIPGIKIIKETDSHVFIEAGAGVIWHELVLFCIKRNFGGIENLSLIPGTAGAAPMQNIGAYGQELKNVFYSLRGINLISGETETYFNEDCKFGYRTSIFKKELKDKFVITSITLVLSKQPELILEYGAIKTELEKFKKENITIKDVSDVVIAIRKSKLPDPAEIGNAGSFFKNPVLTEEKYFELKNKYDDVVGYPQNGKQVKVAAGWLIEKAGWKGKRIGDAGSHVKQSLVLVNYGNASGKNILDLARQIKNSVFEKFGIMLEEEVNIIQ